MKDCLKLLNPQSELISRNSKLCPNINYKTPFMYQYKSFHIWRYFSLMIGKYTKTEKFYSIKINFFNDKM